MLVVFAVLPKLLDRSGVVATVACRASSVLLFLPVLERRAPRVELAWLNALPVVLLLKRVASRRALSIE